MFFKFEISLIFLAAALTLSGCNGNKETLKERPDPGPSITEEIYEISSLSGDKNYLSEFTNTDFSYTFVYINQSRKLVDGIVTESLPIAAPRIVSSDNVEVIPDALPTLTPYICGEITTLGPGESCEFKVTSIYPAPAVSTYVEDIQISFDVKSDGDPTTYTSSINFSRIFNPDTNKRAVATVSAFPYDYGLPEMQEGGDTKGMTLAVTDLASQTTDYVGSCEILNDGTPGDPRGILPWVNSEGKKSIKYIGDKIFFAGRGCAWDGDSVEWERWAMWEFDSSQPKGPNNPRRISRLPSLNANWYGQSSPHANSMHVLNDKLYFISVSETGAALYTWNDDRMAFFEYDPSQPFVPGTNPKEILTGYENHPGEWSSDAYLATVANGKVYFTGKYFTQAPDVALGGVIEYDPSLPLTYNDPSAVEPTDNPRFVWGFNDTDYPLWMMELSDHQLYVDHEVIAISAKLPQDIANPNQTPSTDGVELYFIRIADGEVTKHDLCQGVCDSFPRNITRVQDSFFVTATVERAGGSMDRAVTIIQREDDGSGNPVFVNSAVLNINPDGDDITPNAHTFKIAQINDQLFIPLFQSNGIKNLFRFDPSDTSMTGLFSGDFLGGPESYELIEVMDGQRLSWKNQDTSGFYYDFVVYDPASPVNGTDPWGAHSNPLAKLYFFPASWGEDADNYYVYRVQLCGDGLNGWYLEATTKNMDFMTQRSLGKYTNVCTNPVRYIADELLFIKDL